MARAIARVPILGSLLSVEGNEVEVGGDLPVSGHEENGVWHHTLGLRRPQVFLVIFLTMFDSRGWRCLKSCAQRIHCIVPIIPGPATPS